MSLWYDLSRNVFHECFLGFERTAAASRETYAFADSENMGVNSHCGLIEDNGQHHICSFSPDTRNCHQLVYVVGHLAVKIFNKSSCRTYDVAGLVIGI